MNVHRPELARLIDALREQYQASPRGQKMTSLHLFGIIHAEELRQIDTADLEAVASAAGSTSFATELRKMVKLARFVEPRGESYQRPPLSEVFRRYARPIPSGYVFDRDEANSR